MYTQYNMYTQYTKLNKGIHYAVTISCTLHSDNQNSEQYK